MDCSSITDFQQSTAIRIAKKFRNLHIGKRGDTTDDLLFSLFWTIVSECGFYEFHLAIILPLQERKT